MRVIKSILLLSLTLISLLLASSSMAEIILHGTVREKYAPLYPKYFNSYNRDKAGDYFPRNHYRYRMFAYDLKYDDKVPLKRRKYDLNDYAGNIEANLNLIASNKKTHTYTYKLSLKVSYLYYTGSNLTKTLGAGGAPFTGNVKVYDGSPAVFIIEVSVGHDKNGNPVLINSENNKFFKLDFSWHSLVPTLTRAHDFPVTMIGSYR